MINYDKFPLQNPIKTEWLNVEENHHIYYETSGNPEGIPILRLHGGPGYHSKTKNNQMYDPEKYFLILFDQRGCGKSKPYGEIKENTTTNLINDIESLRKHLNIQQWIVTGNSWGSTLSLLYAQSHPNRVLALGLGAIFLAEKEDIQWVYEGGAGKFFPEKYREFSKNTPAGQTNFDHYTSSILDTNNSEIIKKASLDFMNYVGYLCDMEENQLVELEERQVTEQEMSEDEKRKAQENFEQFAITHARIEMYYERNNFFIEEGQILKNMHKIQHIPLFIVHGRYDLLCPVKSAYTLHQTHNNSHLTIIPDAGHSSPSSTPAYLKMINHDIYRAITL